LCVGENVRIEKSEDNFSSIYICRVFGGFSRVGEVCPSFKREKRAISLYLSVNLH